MPLSLLIHRTQHGRLTIKSSRDFECKDIGLHGGTDEMSVCMEYTEEYERE